MGSDVNKFLNDTIEKHNQKMEEKENIHR